MMLGTGKHVIGIVLIAGAIATIPHAVISRDQSPANVRGEIRRACSKLSNERRMQDRCVVNDMRARRSMIARHYPGYMIEGCKAVAGFRVAAKQQSNDVPLGLYSETLLCLERQQKEFDEMGERRGILR
ncbi:hypothetical protein [Sinorhizobium sojae]|uniref:hypothetical protein n=1 Tax=Sinorhizobium sojae TaxID=716925 RepID=UPI0005552F35|nr:hypothetical protein [Sinorhizobium sojae]